MLLGSYADSIVNSPVRSLSRGDGKALEDAGVSNRTPETEELVQLPSGRIVLAASEEGRSLDAPREEIANPTATAMTQSGGATQRGLDIALPGSDDQVRRLWSDMRLSNKARSKSPSAPPQPRWSYN